MRVREGGCWLRLGDKRDEAREGSAQGSLSTGQSPEPKGLSSYGMARAELFRGGGRAPRGKEKNNNFTSKPTRVISGLSSHCGEQLGKGA